MIDYTKLKTAAAKQYEAEQASIEADNAAARKELAESDWYYIRELETGKAMPASVKAARAAARARVV